MQVQRSTNPLHLVQLVQWYDDPRYKANLPASTDPNRRRPGGYKPKRWTCERRFLNFHEYLKPPLYCFLAPSEDAVSYEDNRFYEEITDVCCHVFRVDEFRPFQLPAMTAALEGFDIILNSTTGSGKSLAYQVPAHIQRYHHNSVTLVFLPRQALVGKEVAAGHSLQLKWAGSIGNDRHAEELLNPALQDFPEIFFLCYQALDGARYEKIKSLCRNKHVARVVLDEAQVVCGDMPSTWFTNLISLRTSHPSIPWTVLSATMAPSKRDILLEKLKLGSCVLIQGSVDRKNLHFAIEHISSRTIRGVVEWKLAYLLALIKRRPGHQILVYCRRTNEVDTLKKELLKRGPDGLRCTTYHGKNTEERDVGFMEKWNNNCYDIVVATNALGLGVHKDNIRYVIHWSTPESMDAYMQECGRGGRDGKPVKCILFYSYWDTFEAIRGAPPDKYAPAIEQALPVIKMAEAPWTCRRIRILSHYNELPDPELPDPELPDPAYTCGNCDVCFAADTDLPHTTNIEQDVGHVQELFRGDQFRTFTRTALRKKIGYSQHRQRVVEYLIFKGILKECPETIYNALICRLMMVSHPGLIPPTTMPAQRPPRLPNLRKLPSPPSRQVDPRSQTQAASFNKRPSSDCEDVNSMVLDDGSEDESKDMVHHSPVTSTVELRQPMDDSDVGGIDHEDHECFNELSKWLSTRRIPTSRTLRKFLVEQRHDSRFRDAFGLRPELVNRGVPRDEMNRILYDPKVFLGINKVLDKYLR